MIAQSLGLEGRFYVEHYGDNGGFLKGVYHVKNGITNQGKMKILDCMFNSGQGSNSSQIAYNSWYIGLIDNTGSPSLVNGDLMGAHGGWLEFTSYSGNRQLWTQGVAASNAVTNSSPVVFSISAPGTLYGIFIVSVATSGGPTDILWSTAAFTATVPVVNTDQMKVTYTLAT